MVRCRIQQYLSWPPALFCVVLFCYYSGVSLFFVASSSSPPSEDKIPDSTLPESFVSGSHDESNEGPSSGPDHDDTAHIGSDGRPDPNPDASGLQAQLASTLVKDPSSASAGATRPVQGGRAENDVLAASFPAHQKGEPELPHQKKRAHAGDGVRKRSPIASATSAPSPEQHHQHQVPSPQETPRRGMIDQRATPQQDNSEEATQDDIEVVEGEAAASASVISNPNDVVDRFLPSFLRSRTGAQGAAASSPTHTPSDEEEASSSSAPASPESRSSSPSPPVSPRYEEISSGPGRRPLRRVKLVRWAPEWTRSHGHAAESPADRRGCPPVSYAGAIKALREPATEEANTTQADTAVQKRRQHPRRRASSAVGAVGGVVGRGPSVPDGRSPVAVVVASDTPEVKDRGAFPAAASASGSDGKRKAQARPLPWSRQRRDCQSTTTSSADQQQRPQRAQHPGKRGEPTEAKTPKPIDDFSKFSKAAVLDRAHAESSSMPYASVTEGKVESATDEKRTTQGEGEQVHPRKTDASATQGANADVAESEGAAAVSPLVASPAPATAAIVSHISGDTVASSVVPTPSAPAVPQAEGGVTDLSLPVLPSSESNILSSSRPTSPLSGTRGNDYASSSPTAVTSPNLSLSYTWSSVSLLPDEEKVPEPKTLPPGTERVMSQGTRETTDDLGENSDRAASPQAPLAPSRRKRGAHSRKTYAEAQHAPVSEASAIMQRGTGAGTPVSAAFRASRGRRVPAGRIQKPLWEDVEPTRKSGQRPREQTQQRRGTPAAKQQVGASSNQRRRAPLPQPPPSCPLGAYKRSPLAHDTGEKGSLPVGSPPASLSWHSTAEVSLKAPDTHRPLSSKGATVGAASAAPAASPTSEPCRKGFFARASARPSQVSHEHRVRKNSVHGRSRETPDREQPGKHFGPVVHSPASHGPPPTSDAVVRPRTSCSSTPTKDPYRRSSAQVLTKAVNPAAPAHKPSRHSPRSRARLRNSQVEVGIPSRARSHGSSTMYPCEPSGTTSVGAAMRVTPLGGSARRNESRENVSWRSPCFSHSGSDRPDRRYIWSSDTDGGTQESSEPVQLLRREPFYTPFSRVGTRSSRGHQASSPGGVRVASPAFCDQTAPDAGIAFSPDYLVSSLWHLLSHSEDGGVGESSHLQEPYSQHTEEVQRAVSVSKDNLWRLPSDPMPTTAADTTFSAFWKSPSESKEVHARDAAFDGGAGSLSPSSPYTVDVMKFLLKEPDAGMTHPFSTTPPHHQRAQATSSHSHSDGGGHSSTAWMSASTPLSSGGEGSGYAPAIPSDLGEFPILAEDFRGFWDLLNSDRSPGDDTFSSFLLSMLLVGSSALPPSGQQRREANKPDSPPGLKPRRLNSLLDGLPSVLGTAAARSAATAMIRRKKFGVREQSGATFRRSGIETGGVRTAAAAPADFRRKKQRTGIANAGEQKTKIAGIQREGSVCRRLNNDGSYKHQQPKGAGLHMKSVSDVKKNPIEIIGMLFIAVASAVAVAAGAGGGAIYVPILILVMQFTPYEAVATSQALIFGGSLAGTILNFFRRHPYSVAQPVIDMDMVVLMGPMQIAGATVGVVVNRCLPTYIILGLLVGLLLFMFYKTVLQARRIRKESKGVSVEETHPLSFREDKLVGAPPEGIRKKKHRDSGEEETENKEKEREVMTSGEDGEDGRLRLPWESQGQATKTQQQQTEEGTRKKAEDEDERGEQQQQQRYQAIHIDPECHVTIKEQQRRMPHCRQRLEESTSACVFPGRSEMAEESDKLGEGEKERTVEQQPISRAVQCHQRVAPSFSKDIITSVAAEESHGIAAGSQQHMNSVETLSGWTNSGDHKDNSVFFSPSPYSFCRRDANLETQRHTNREPVASLNTCSLTSDINNEKGSCRVFVTDATAATMPEAHTTSVSSDSGAEDVLTGSAEEAAAMLQNREVGNNEEKQTVGFPTREESALRREATSAVALLRHEEKNTVPAFSVGAACGSTSAKRQLSVKKNLFACKGRRKIDTWPPHYDCVEAHAYLSLMHAGGWS